MVSDPLTEADTAPWSDTTTIVRRVDAHQAVAELKQQPGNDILMFGSRTLWNELLATSCTSCSAPQSSAAAPPPSAPNRSRTGRMRITYIRGLSAVRPK